MGRFIGVVGFIVLLGIAFLLSNDKRKVSIRTVLVGVGIQFAFGLVLLKWQPGAAAIRWVADRVADFLMLSRNGYEFLFGNIVKPEFINTFGFQFAFTVLPVIIFFSAFIAILYHLGVIQRVIQAFAWVMSKLMRTSGAESLSCAANAFVGMVEAPMVVRPFISRMTMSELMTIMVGGFATISGSVMGGYIMMGIPAVHIIIASVMSVPAALMVGKIIYPEVEQPETVGNVKVARMDTGTNILDAATTGTSNGLKVALTVGAMLMSFLTLIAFVNAILGGFDRLIDGRLLGGQLMANGEYAGYFPGSLKTLFGTVFAPLVFIMGVPAADMKEVGNLLGLKIAINEFVAYTKLSGLMAGQAISHKSQIMATYMLCGFANFGSIGITIGGLSAMAPERRSDLSRLALKAMIGGALASFMTAVIAGLFYSV